MVAFAAAVFAGFLLVANPSIARQISNLQREILPHQFDVTSDAYSLNVSSCPGTLHFLPCAIHYPALIISTAGYTLSSLKETNSGLTAQLSLAGDACNAFGHDISNLTIQVTYETETRCDPLVADF